LQHDAIEGRGDRVGAHAVVALDRDQRLAAPDAIALLDLDRAHDAREACLDLRAPVVIHGDAAHHLDGHADDGRTGVLDHHTAGFGGLGRDCRAALIGVVGPGMGVSRVLGFDFHIEGMRLGDLTAAGQVLAFRLEGEYVGFPVQSLERDGGNHFGGIDRLAVLVGVKTELRRDVGFEDGDLDGEIPIAQHAAAMGATLVVAAGWGRFNSSVTGLGCRFTATRHHQQRQQQENEMTTH